MATGNEAVTLGPALRDFRAGEVCFLGPTEMTIEEDIAEGEKLQVNLRTRKIRKVRL